MIIAERNPLLVDLVAQRVLEFLQEKDLKSCRLVCSRWYYPATMALKKTAKSIAFGDLYKVNVIRLRPDLETIKVFLSTMDSCEILPYVKFNLKPCIWAPNCLPVLEEFLTNYSPLIEVLMISLAFESSDVFPKGCFPNMNLCNLRSLDFCNTLRGEMRPSLRTELLTSRYNLLESILNAAPNLQSLCFWCDSENLAWPGEAIEVLKEAKLPKLTHLKLSFPLTNFQLLNLSNLNVRLTSFTFLIREPLFNTQSFYEVLKSQRNTLETLKLVDLQCEQVKFVELPQMNRLRELIIEGTFYGDNCMLAMLNFSFKRVPKLQSLVLRNCHSRNFDLHAFLTMGGQCDSLTEFHAIASHDFLNAKWIKEMPKQFPNLNNLHILFSPEAKDLLTIVFQHLVQLTHLTVNVRKCGENIDNILSGIQSKLIWDKNLLPEISSRFEEMEFSHLKSCPGLRNLKRLKTLEFKGEHRNYKPGVSAFTDISAYLAFLQVKTLRNLILHRTGLKLSEICLQHLTQKLHVVQIPPEN